MKSFFRNFLYLFPFILLGALAFGDYAAGTYTVIAPPAPTSPSTQNETTRAYTWYIPGASSSCISQPINVTGKRVAALQIYHATPGTASPLNAGSYTGSASGTWWIEGQAGTSASEIVSYSTLPITTYVSGTSSSAMVSCVTCGIYYADFHGTGFIRFAMTGGSANAASYCIKISLK